MQETTCRSVIFLSRGKDANSTGEGLLPPEVKGRGRLLVGVHGRGSGVMGRRPSHPRVCAACDVGDNAPVADVGGGLAGSTMRFCAGLLPPGSLATDVVTGVVTAAITQVHERENCDEITQTRCLLSHKSGV